MQAKFKYTKALLSVIAALAVLCSSILIAGADSAGAPGGSTDQTENAYDTLIVFLKDNELDMSIFEGIDFESVSVVRETPIFTVSVKLKHPGAENAFAARQLLMFNLKVGYVEVEGIISLDPREDVMIGDINRDDILNATDIMLLRKHLAEPYLTGIALFAANANVGDSEINVLDIMALRKRILEFPWIPYSFG